MKVKSIKVKNQSPASKDDLISFSIIYADGSSEVLSLISWDFMRFVNEHTDISVFFESCNFGKVTGINEWIEHSPEIYYKNYSVDGIRVPNGVRKGIYSE